MNFTTILLIATGLSLDALAVAVTYGLATKTDRVRGALLLACFFGGFQAAMPVLGWLLGHSVRDLIAAYDHWLAFGLLLFVGGKMIHESFRTESSVNSEKSYGLKTIFALALATSIDALAVGLSFSFLEVLVFWPALIIGLTTFFLTIFGFVLGQRLGHFFENRLELAGGLLLVAIGSKILLSHRPF
jgi:manganese efflux pump family protein